MTLEYFRTKKFRGRFVSSFTGLILLFAYNNCSGGFQNAANVSDDTSLSSTTPPTPPPIPPPVLHPPAEDDYKPSDGPVAMGKKIVNVANASEFLSAIAVASPGDEITLADGVYNINTDKVRVNRSGTAADYIFIRSQNPLKATIKLCTSSAEGFYLNNTAYWVFENLVIDNGCEAQTDHSFHIVGNSRHIILRSNVITNFRSHIKVNGDNSPRVYPEDLWFIKNTWKMTRDLSVKAVPHNVLNVDGGHRMVIRGNVFVDQMRTNGSSSSIYVKMGTTDFVVEQNLVVCQKRLTASGYSPRGIYSGDAGSGPNPLCENQDCFNDRGVYRNNIVMNCAGDGNVSGIQIRLERATKYIHNTVVGVKNNFLFDDPAPVDVSLYSNIMEKPFTFQGATRPTQYLDNLEQGTVGTSQIWTNGVAGNFSLKDGTAIRGKAQKRGDAPHDFCGHLRSNQTDLGAIDYSHPKATECVQYIKSLYEAL